MAMEDSENSKRFPLKKPFWKKYYSEDPLKRCKNSLIIAIPAMNYETAKKIVRGKTPDVCSDGIHIRSSLLQKLPLVEIKSLANNIAKNYNTRVVVLNGFAKLHRAELFLKELYNREIEVLIFNNGYISETVAESLRNVLSTNPDLKYFGLRRSNFVNKKAAEMILNSIRNLEEIDLRGLQHSYTPKSVVKETGNYIHEILSNTITSTDIGFVNLGFPYTGKKEEEIIKKWKKNLTEDFSMRILVLPKNLMRAEFKGLLANNRATYNLLIKGTEDENKSKKKQDSADDSLHDIRMMGSPLSLFNEEYSDEANSDEEKNEKVTENNDNMVNMGDEQGSYDENGNEVETEDDEQLNEGQKSQTNNASSDAQAQESKIEITVSFKFNIWGRDNNTNTGKNNIEDKKNNLRVSNSGQKYGYGKK